MLSFLLKWLLSHNYKSVKYDSPAENIFILKNPGLDDKQWTRFIFIKWEQTLKGDYISDSAI